MIGRSIAIALLLAACQSGQAPASPAGPDAAAGAPRAQPAAPLQLELTYLRACPAGATPRRASVSASSGRLTVRDEAGEARQAAISHADLAKLAEALRRAHFATITTRPGKGRTDGCAVTISAALDGAEHTVQDSPTSQVDPASAADWQRAQAAVEALIAAHP